MLSKLLFFSQHSSKEKDHLRNKIDPSEVLRSLDQKDCKIRRLSEGTLSTSFLAHTGDTSIFLKSPLTADGVANLRRQVKILRHLYCDVLDAEHVVVDTAGKPQHWLVMSKLEHYDRAITPTEIRAILKHSVERLNYDNFLEIERPIEMHQPLMVEAYSALTNLADRSMIDHLLYDELHGYLRLLDEGWVDLPAQLCHGDLGPQNIMQMNGQPIVIDWEDFCTGFSGYDYLYWLTFMVNRQYYGFDMWNKTSLPNSQIELAVMISIVLLKSELALRSDAVGQLKLSFSARLLEIIKYSVRQ